MVEIIYAPITSAAVFRIVAYEQHAYLAEVVQLLGVVYLSLLINMIY